MKDKLLTFAIAVGFGFALSRIGFSSWDEVHAMFTFADLRLFFAFLSAVMLLAFVWPFLGRMQPGRAPFRTRAIHRGTVLGGLSFGVGWALCGACPAIAVVQLGEGQLAAGWTLLGILVGNHAYATLHARVLRWDSGSCLDD